MEGFEPILWITIVYCYCILANWRSEEMVARLIGEIIVLPGSSELKLQRLWAPIHLVDKFCLGRIA